MASRRFPAVTIACLLLSISGQAADVRVDVIFALGQPAPGVPGGVFATAQFESGENISLNSAGQTAFVASLQPGGDITSANDYGIWFGRPGELQLIAREGGPAGLGDDVVFGGGFIKHDVSDAGHVLFDATVT